MVYRGNKPNKSLLAIRDHLPNYLERSKHYNDNKLTTLIKKCNIYHLSVLEPLYKKL